MLISHSRYTFNFESAYKKPSPIKVATFFSYVILVSSYQLCKAKEKIKLIPYYLYNRYFIYKIVKISHLKKLQII